MFVASRPEQHEPPKGKGVTTMLLFATGTPHLPDVVGGLERNTHELVLELNRRGERAAVLSRLSRRDWRGRIRSLVNRSRRMDVTSDRRLGYDVYRARKPWDDLRGVPLPKVVVVQNGRMIEIARAFLRRGVPSVAYLHGTGFEQGANCWNEPASSLPFCAYIANSMFTAARFFKRFNIQPCVVPPVFRPDRYQAAGERNCVTFINPVPEKGLELAIGLAGRCPQIPFRFIKCWPLSVWQCASLKGRLQRLSNVRLVERTEDMRPIYAATRVLLVPSQVDETWGRAASEAQFSGIPVLASNAGGLPEAVGPGGVILPRDASLDVWTEELLRLWDDRPHYSRLSAAASTHAQRAAVNLDCQIERLLSIVKGV